MAPRFAGMDCEGACSSLALVVAGWACFHGASILGGDFTAASTNMAVYGVMQLPLAALGIESGSLGMVRRNGKAGWFGGSGFQCRVGERKIWNSLVHY